MRALMPGNFSPVWLWASRHGCGANFGPGVTGSGGYDEDPGATAHTWARCEFDPGSQNPVLNLLTQLLC